MKTLTLPIAFLGLVGLGGCTTLDDMAYGSSYGQNPYYGSAYGQGHYGMGGPSFREAAVEGCAVQAQRHGRVSIGSVQQTRADMFRVYGSIALYNRYEQRPFSCSFRSDGRITDFDID